MYSVLVILAILNLKISTSYDQANMEIHGDFMLGAVFPTRKYGDSKKCGELEATFVLQAEAFRLSLEYVNEHVLHGYTFGGFVVDECDHEIIGLQSAVRLMAGEMASSRGLCDNMSKVNKSRMIFGMTGGMNSVISEHVEPLLEVFCLPLISTYATSPKFDDMATYQYFLRTVPTDVFQAQAIYDLLKRMNWHTVLLIHETTSYGTGLRDKFKEIVDAEEQKISKYSSEFNSRICVVDYVPVSNKMTDFSGLNEQIIKSEVKVIVLITDFTMAGKIFQYVENQSKNAKTIQWVGTDGWSRTQATAGVEASLENATTTEFLSYDMQLMKDFLDNLTFRQINQSRNPWLQELVLKKQYNCTNDSETICIGYNNDEKVNISNSDAGLGRSYYVFEAVYAFAQAFETLRKQYCPEYDQLCDNFYRANGSELLTALRNVIISDPNQLPVEFRFQNNSGPPNYSVFQYQKLGDHYKWVTIGNWSEGNLNLIPPCTWNHSRDCIRLKSDLEPGRCRKNCSNFQKITPMEGKKCCHECEECRGPFDFINRTSDDCQNCPVGYKPDTITFDHCIPESPVVPDTSDKLIVFLLIVALLGIVLCFFVAVSFILYRHTPAAVLASFPICLTESLAIACLLASSALTAARPRDWICILQWSLQPFILTLVVGIIWIRVIRQSNEHLEFANFKSAPSIRTGQLIQLFGLCLAELAIIIIRSLIDRPKDESEREPGTRYVYMERKEFTFAACASIKEIQTLFILFILPFAFVLMTFVLSIRRSKSGTIFERREYRRIAWSCVLIFVLFACIATPIFASDNKLNLRAAAQMAVLIVCGLIILVIVYIPTVYLMIKGTGNTWLHLTRDVKEDERISSDQLKLTDEVLGEGYFCEVRRGSYERNAKQTLDVAVKIAKRGTLNNPTHLLDLTGSLLQEIVILRHVRDCEHVVRWYGVCNDAESMLFVFEYMNGGSCRKFVPNRRSQLTNADLLWIASNIADALWFLKQKSIVHRDVKCENCLVQERLAVGQANAATTTKYRAKLADFGVAVEANAGKVDQRRKILFPERYTAPEGFSGEFSHESDVWSFGVFVWELFALKTSDHAIPYESIVRDDIESHIVSGNILHKPQAANADVYENIMKPCWEYEPAGRIDIKRLKHQLLIMTRKNANNGNGTLAKRKHSHLTVSTPDLLNGSIFWASEPSTAKTSPIPGSSPPDNSDYARVYYKKPVISSDIQHSISAPGSILTTHQLKPSILTINMDDDIDNASAGQQNSCSEFTTGSAYKKLT